MDEDDLDIGIGIGMDVEYQGPPAGTFFTEDNKPIISEDGSFIIKEDA